MQMHYREINSPLGNILLQCNDYAITGLWLDREIPGGVNSDNPLLLRAQAWLDAYFRGENPALDFPLQPEGTAFQKEHIIPNPLDPTARGADDGCNPIGTDGGADFMEHLFFLIGNAEILQRKNRIAHFFLLHANQVAAVLATSTTSIITKAVP